MPERDPRGRVQTNDPPGEFLDDGGDPVPRPYPDGGTVVGGDDPGQGASASSTGNPATGSAHDPGFDETATSTAAGEAVADESAHDVKTAGRSLEPPREQPGAGRSRSILAAILDVFR